MTEFNIFYTQTWAGTPDFFKIQNQNILLIPKDVMCFNH